jgi:subtilase family serine protease
MTLTRRRIGQLAGLGAVVFALSAGAALPAVGVARPDLVEGKVSNPPEQLGAGQSFKITDLTRNRGLAAARATTTGYYLAKSGTRTLIGSRKVRRLGAGATSTGSAIATVPRETRVGLYSVVACADASHKVRESREWNNCRAAARQLLVGKPPPPPD